MNELIDDLNFLQKTSIQRNDKPTEYTQNRALDNIIKRSNDFIQIIGRKNKSFSYERKNQIIKEAKDQNLNILKEIYTQSTLQ